MPLYTHTQFEPNQFLLCGRLWPFWRGMTHFGYLDTKFGRQSRNADVVVVLNVYFFFMPQVFRNGDVVVILNVYTAADGYLNLSVSLV